MGPGHQLEDLELAQRTRLAIQRVEQYEQNPGGNSIGPPRALQGLGLGPEQFLVRQSGRLPGHGFARCLTAGHVRDPSLPPAFRSADQTVRRQRGSSRPAPR